MKDIVAVTGASGGIGQALLEQLIDLYSVRVLFRAKSDLSARWAARGCTVVIGDLDDEAALAELATGARLVFHCAALVTRASYEQAKAVNVDGTRRLARAAAAAGCRRVVHLSSAAVYSGASSDTDYDESMPLVERDDMAVYSRTKLQSERALQEVARASGFEYVILRPTSVYGPHTKSHTLIPIDLIRKGLPVVIGDGDGLLDVVYVDDVARAMVLAGQSPEAAGEVFNIGHEAVTFNELYAHYCLMLNRPARRLPLSVVTGLMWLIQHLPGRDKPHRREARNAVGLLRAMALNTIRVSSWKARSLLGFTPAIGLETGMLRTELWLKREAMIPSGPYALASYGPLPFRPLTVVHPSTEEDLVAIVGMARQRGLELRAIGSLHSPCELPFTDGICVVLDRYKAVVGVDGPLVTVQAGMKIHELNDFLAGKALALATNGSITAQTVSGAISTATHGGSTTHGSISDYVASIRIVRADGSVVAVDRGQAAFPAVVVSLGLLGIISTVTFRCVPAFALRSSSSVMSAKDALDRFDEINRRSPHCCIFYFPVTDQMEVLAIEQVDAWDGVPSGVPPRKPADKPLAGIRARATYGLAKLALPVLARVLARHVGIHRFLVRSSVGKAYPLRTDRSDRVLAMSDVGTSGRSPALLRDMEVAVAYDQAPRAIAALRSHFLSSGTYPLLPIHIRCAARSEHWLSPAYGTDVCYLEFWQAPGADDLFAKVHELLTPFRYRFHWGKETRADRKYIEQQYDKWDEFTRLREAWDPTGTFLNRYLRRFFAREQAEQPPQNA